MTRFWGLARYEYRMSIQRWVIWVILGLLFAFYSANAVMVDVKPGAQPWDVSDVELWQTAGLLAFSLNLLSPLVAGIALADRMQRDVRLGVDELLASTALTRRAYILGKYVGGLFSMLTPMFLMMTLMGLLTVLTGAPLVFFGRLLLGFLAINVPAFAFVAIFSLGFPLVMPVRVYQVLFTGYWFWGNFLNPKVFPTLSHTLLAPGGRYALEAFFGTHFGAPPGYEGSSQLEALLNLAVLAACILAGMFLLDRYLAWRAGRD
jgi:ABC-type transport system involved in multi-copper enzyme maturation permease subunit